MGIINNKEEEYNKVDPFEETDISKISPLDKTSYVIYSYHYDKVEVKEQARDISSIGGENFHVIFYPGKMNDFLSGKDDIKNIVFFHSPEVLLNNLVLEFFQKCIYEDWGDKLGVVFYKETDLAPNKKIIRGKELYDLVLKLKETYRNNITVEGIDYGYIQGSKGEDNFDTTYRYFTEVLNIDPENIITTDNFDDEKTLEDLVRTVAKNPKNKLCLWNIGSFFYNDGRIRTDLLYDLKTNDNYLILVKNDCKFSEMTDDRTHGCDTYFGESMIKLYNVCDYYNRLFNMGVFGRSYKKSKIEEVKANDFDNNYNIESLVNKIKNKIR